MATELIYTSMDSLKPIAAVLGEASEALEDKTRTKSSLPQINEALMAAGGLVTGGGISFAALYLGGSVVGLSAAGITSGLAAAGALIGGGMAAGIFVLAAPIAVLGVLGYALGASRNKKKLLEAKEILLQEAMKKQNAIINEIGKESKDNHERVEYLTRLNILLQAAINDLTADLELEAA